MKINYSLNNYKWLRFMTYYKFAKFASGIKSCYKFDSRVQTFVDSLPDGFDMCIGVLNTSQIIVLTKLEKKIQISIEDDYAPDSNSIVMMFKNIASARRVIGNKLTIKEAFLQGRFVVVGATDKCTDFITMLFIVQSYLITIVSKNLTTQLMPLEVPASLIKSNVLFRGWL